MKRKIISYFLASAAVVIFAGLAQAQQKFVAALNSMQVVPHTDSTARGSCTVNHPNMFTMNITCEYSGLSSNLTKAYFRVASAGQNGGSLIPISEAGGTSGTFSFGITAFANFTPGLVEKRFYIDLRTATYPEGEIRGQIKVVTLDADVDGEGRTEISVFRSSDAFSYAYCSMMDILIAQQLDWHSRMDSTPFFADFDGDGIAERAFTRSNKLGEITTIYTRSRDNQTQKVQWGNALLGDERALGDYDADGKIDIAVFRKPEGVWYILQSSNNQPRYEFWGQPGGNDQPCPGDYDKDGKTDLCVVREENNQLAWYIRRSSNNQIYKAQFGLSTDTFYPNNPVDVDADGANDILVSRETDGKRYFYALRSSDNSLFAFQWGLSTDQTKLGDYDADGKTDFAAIREINNQLVWYIYESRNRQLRAFNWGLSGDQ